jgi:hypothetical protein
MANNNVRFFKVAKLQTYLDLAVKDANSLYWVDETQSLYLADKLYGTGRVATEEFAGLLSAEDYKKLQELIVSGGTVDLTPVDGSIVIEDKKIGVGLSAVEGNILSINEDGLFATVDTKPIENRLTAVEGRLDPIEQDIESLKNAIVGGIRYKGSVPSYDYLPKNATQGDLYEVSADGSEWCFNGNEWFEYGTSRFVPVAGAGIIVDGSTIGVKVADESHGLTTVDGSMTMLLATAEQDGAMSKEDKAALDALIALDVADNFATKDEVQAVADTVASVRESFTWDEM